MFGEYHAFFRLALLHMSFNIGILIIDIVADVLKDFAHFNYNSYFLIKSSFLSTYWQMFLKTWPNILIYMHMIEI